MDAVFLMAFKVFTALKKKQKQKIKPINFYITLNVTSFKINILKNL